MTIFTDEFKTYIKGLIFCSWRGHSMPQRYTNHQKHCTRCGVHLRDRRGLLKLSRGVLFANELQNIISGKYRASIIKPSKSQLKKEEEALKEYLKGEKESWDDDDFGLN